MRKIWFLPVVVILSGCGQGGGTMTYTIGQQGGHATLSLGGTTLIFEGIPAGGADVKDKTTGFFMVSGSGTIQGQSSVDGVTLKHSYANGVTQLSLGDYRFQVTEGGKKLVFGEQTFGVGAPFIRVDKEGKARSEWGL